MNLERNRSWGDWPSTSSAVLLALMLVSCTDVNEPATVIETEPTSSNAAYEAGYDLLFNAPTRFEYPQAITLLEQAVAEEADNPAARLALSYAYTKLGQHEKAEPHVAVGLQLSDSLSPKQALWLAAIDARVADDWAREAAAWEAVVERFPNDRWAWYELASAYTVQYVQDAAATAAERALQLESDPAKWEAGWVYYLHSKALFRSGRPEEAIQAAEAGRNNATTWRSTYYRRELAAVASGQQDADASVQAYRELSAAEGRNDKPYTETNIALFYFELGDHEKAIEHARAALELSQTPYQYWVLAYSLIENGDVSEALQVSEEALAAFPVNSYILAAHGWAQYRLGKFAEARESLLAARAAAGRKQYQIEWSIGVVEDAIEHPDAVPAPPIPWLG